MRAHRLLLLLPAVAACYGLLDARSDDGGLGPTPPADASATPPVDVGPPPSPPKSAETIADGVQPTDFAIDDTSVYWTNFLPKAVFKVSKSGGAAVAIAVAATGTELHGIAVGGPDLFWTQAGSVADTGAVFRANVDGSAVTPIVTEQRNPWGIAVDATHVFWVNTWGNGGGDVMRAGRDGSSPKVIATVPTVAYSITASEGWLCWYGEGAWCSDVDGTNVTNISTDDVWSVAIDGGAAYYVERHDGVLRRAPMGGGPSEAIAVVTPRYTAPVAVDTTHVYTSASGWPGIQRFTKTPNPTPDLLTVVFPTHEIYESTSKIALDDTHLYYFGMTGGSNVSIKRRPK